MLALFSKMYYQYQITDSVVSTKTDNEFIETKIRIYSDIYRKHKSQYIPLTLNDIIHNKYRT